MERLTETWEENGEKFACFISCKENCLNHHESSCQCRVVVDVMKRLIEYENTGLTPDEIKELKK